MILLLDTSSRSCRLTLRDNDGREVSREWLADRQLAKGLLGFISQSLKDSGQSLGDISAIGVKRGPGSFTGLRIGITVANTLAESLGVAIVGTTGDDWLNQAQQRLEHGENDRIVLPHYGADANITKPVK